MGTSSRDLRVRFIGDAGSLSKTFQDVSTGAAAAEAGLHSSGTSAENVGKTFSRTGKVFKSTGKILKSSGLDAASAGAGFLSTIPALSGMAAGAGGLVTQLDALSSVAGSLGPVGLPVLAAAAVAAGAAFVIFRDRVSVATEALNLQREANEKLAEQHRKTGEAVTAHQDAVTSLRGAHLSLRSASLSLEEADKAVAKAQKESGKGSLEYRQALLGQAQAQEQVRTSRQEVIRQSVEALRTTKASAKAIDDEVVATRAAADEARKRAVLLRLSGITGKDAAAANVELKKTLNAEQKAASQSAAKHRDNAQRAREMADAIGTATPRAKVLHDKLLELSRTEVNMAAAISAMNALRSAADNASAGIANVVSWLQRAQDAGSVPSGGGGGGGRPKKSGGPGGQTADALPRRNPLAPFLALAGDRAGLTPADRADAAIAARHRGDSLQDKKVGAAAAAAAKAGGVTNPDKLQAISDRAIAKVRKAELDRDVARIRSAVKKTMGQIRAAQKKLADQRAKRRTAKKDDQAKLDSAIDATRQRISGLWDQHRALVREGNETIADARELGYDIKQMDLELGGMQDTVPPDDAGPTEADRLDAQMAQAQLTPGLEDDLAAAQAMVLDAQGRYGAALVQGDPRVIADNARTLKEALDTRQGILDAMAAKALDENTAAVKDNTEAITQAFGGSTVFSYRGQDYGLRLAPPSSDRLVGAEVGL